MLKPLQRTKRDPWPSARQRPDLVLDREREVLLTFWLPEDPSAPVPLDRARALGSAPPRSRRYLARDEVHDRTDVPSQRFDPLRRFCEANHLELIQTHWRSAVVRGSTGNAMDALSAQVVLGEVAGMPFRMRLGSLHAPPELHETVRVALGLHQWPKSRPFEMPPPAADAAPRPPAMSAAELCARYGVPDGDGAGETIAILQLNSHFARGDFEAAMKAAAVTAQAPVVRRVDDAALSHKVQTAKDLESSIDTQIAAAVAPGARIVIYEAPNSERGLLDALRAAIFDREYAPSIISISFGWGEVAWTPVVLDIVDELFAVAALLGITVICASGDFGSAVEGLLVAPASSALSLSCGATEFDAAGAESVWEHSGGGFSSHFDLPAWQTGAAEAAAGLHMRSGRGTPDLCAAMRFPMCVDGTALSSAGTSAVAPFVAGVFARLNARLGVRCGYVTPLLYGAAAACFRPIASGNTGLFTTAPGWNPCSGNGAPKFDGIERILT